MANHIRIITIKTSSGKYEYVAMIGVQCFDRVGRKSGFKSFKCSPNYASQGQANKWIFENI